MSVNVLVSYGVVPSADLWRLHRQLRCGRVMVDSGAFSAYASGKTIRLAEYAEHLDRWRGAWHHAITLDVIGDPAASARNTRSLHALGLPVLPVFTMGAALPEFDAMVADVGYVAVGGMVGVSVPHQRARLAMLQRRAVERGGGIHALGVANMGTLRAARPYSADASSVSSMYRFGNLLYFDGLELRQVNVKARAKLAAARDHLTAQGIDAAPIIRAGRMPEAGQRHELTRAMAVSYACADEVLKRRPVAAPLAGDPPGTHLYLALGRNTDSLAAAELADVLHGPAAPRAWRRWARGHDCTRGEADGRADAG